MPILGTLRRAAAILPLIAAVILVPPHRAFGRMTTACPAGAPRAIAAAGPPPTPAPAAPSPASRRSPAAPAPAGSQAGAAPAAGRAARDGAVSRHAGDTRGLPGAPHRPRVRRRGQGVPRRAPHAVVRERDPDRDPHALGEGGRLRFRRRGDLHLRGRRPRRQADDPQEPPEVLGHRAVRERRPLRGDEGRDLHGLLPRPPRDPRGRGGAEVPVLGHGARAPLLVPREGGRRGLRPRPPRGDRRPRGRAGPDAVRRDRRQGPRPRLRVRPDRPRRKSAS